MATLFFEGFEKGVIFNQLDPNYWSTQYTQYPKYSFGGYLPVPASNNDKYIGGMEYVYNSPNGGILPFATFRNIDPGSTLWNFGVRNNNYPAFGAPPGFLAFSNIEVENISNLEVPTYLQASGFGFSSGSITYCSMRCLGLESKHIDYSNYPHRHTLFSYNSGNTPMLTVNVVKITGNNQLIPINTKYETLALEIQQNDNTLGYFDLNISNSLSDYKISHVYDTNNKILTIADVRSGPSLVSVISRWCHLEFSIDDSQDEPILSVNAEDINLQVVNSNPGILRENWDTSLPISGFKFDNLRIYNRTYSSSIKNGIATAQISEEVGSSYYYMLGKNWLLDDFVVIDNSGSEPSYWLGSTSRVIQLIPGYTDYTTWPPYTANGRTNLQDNDGKSDGIRDWSTNSVVNISQTNSPNLQSSHRKALSFLDADTNNIETITSGSIDAVAFSERPSIASDSTSFWRSRFNEAIGGVKLYNSARKQYLDTKFVNVFRSGVSDPLENSVSLLLHGDSLPIVDSTRTPKGITTNNSTVYNGEFKFGGGSLSFVDETSSLSISHADLAQNQFTIECWAYFHNHNQLVSLFERKPPNLANNIYADYYAFYLNTSGIIFQRINNCDKVLLFNQPMQTGIWNHVAVVRTSGSDLSAYLNGVRNNSYKITNCENKPNPNETSAYSNNSSNFSFENQGIYNGKYSLFFLNNNNLNSYTNYNGIVTYPELKIGAPSLINSDVDELYANVSLLLKADNGLSDLSSNTKTITNNGVTRSTVRSRFEDKSFYFTGGKTLSFNNSNDFDFDSGNFTIDFWFLLTNTTAGQTYNILNGKIRCFVSIGVGGDTNMAAIYFTVTNNDITYNFIRSLSLTEGYFNNGRRGWYYVSIVRYNTEFFAYVVPQDQTYTPNNNWPPKIMTGDTVSSSAGFVIPNLDFPVDMNNFTLGDTNTGLLHKLYIDNFRITKGIARITSRIQLPVSAPSKPYPSLSIPLSENNPGVYIDEYRITYGANRYNNNFVSPTGAFKSERDDYYPLGPVYDVTKTAYKTFQYYSLINPATQKQWTVPEISGMILGVKKV
jgi:hypothetical protein